MTPNPRNAIQQAIDVFGLLIDQATCMAYERLPQDYEQFGEPRYILEAREALTALRALQDVKMRSAEEWATEWAMQSPDGGIDIVEFTHAIIKRIQNEAFTAGLMAQQDAHKVRNDAFEEAVTAIINALKSKEQP